MWKEFLEKTDIKGIIINAGGIVIAGGALLILYLFIIDIVPVLRENTSAVQVNTEVTRSFQALLINITENPKYINAIQDRMIENLVIK